MTTNPMHQFSLIHDYASGRPIAALIPAGFSGHQIRNIYSLLPPNSLNDPELATRWQCDLVACPPAWAAEQKKRVPMVPPSQRLTLAFL